MSVLPLFTIPSAEARRLATEGRIRFRNRFPDQPDGFDATVWDVRGLRQRSHTISNPRLHFTRHGAPDQPLPPSFADVVRAWVVWDGSAVSTMATKLDAARLLWEALLARGAGEPFDWATLSEEDLRQAEQRMLTAWSPSTTYKAAAKLVQLADFLASRSICRRLRYRVATPRPEDAGQRTLQGMEASASKLPTRTALNGLADVFHRLATEPPDRLLAALMAIVAITGLRIGEALTLPEDCEVVETERAGATIRRRYGLRYYSEKQRGGPRLFDTYWCTEVQAGLVREAVARAREITTAARRRARVLEENPNRVPVPGAPRSGRMTTDQLSAALGLGSRNAAFKIPQAQLPRRAEPKREFSYAVSDVERYLLGRRVRNLWTVDRRDGTFQALSESLFIAFANFFHSAKSTLPLLVEPVNEQHVADFLASRRSSRGSTLSVFERFGIHEPDGRPAEINAHQLRHFINDAADRGGMPIEQLTRWMNRSNPDDSEAYQHMSPRERARWAAEGIRKGDIVGAVADAYHDLPEGIREQWLDHQLMEAHRTGVGLCVHTWSVEPCPYHLNCLRGCRHHLVEKGNPDQRQHLVQIGSFTRRSLDAARAGAADPEGSPAAAAWLQSHEDTLAGADAALAAGERQDAPTGALVRVHPDGPDLYQPFQP